MIFHPFFLPVIFVYWLRKNYRVKAEYLSELLKDNKTVILPGVGAFVNNAPSSPAVSFNPFLKFNDGLLVSYISKKENISAEDAGKKLEVFTSGLQSLLQSGRDVSVKNIGKLKMEGEKIVFTWDAGASETITVQEEKPVMKEEKPEPVKQVIPETKIPEIKKEEQKPVIEKQPEPVKETITASAEKKQEIKTSATEKSKPVVVKKKKSKAWIWIALVLVIVGGGGTAGFLYKDQLMQMLGMGEPTAETKTEKQENNNTKKPAETTENNPADSVMMNEDSLAFTADSAVTVEPEINSTETETKISTTETATETPVKTETITPSSGTYYIIVGCYSQQANADAMMNKISSQGLQPVNLGTFNGLIHVAAFQSSDVHEVANKASELRGVFGKAWIFEQK